MDRLTSGPSGSYTYGDSSHPDAATSIGSAYTAAYDAVGNMVCRAPTASTTCAGSPTGASLSYDNEGRLATWQNAPSSPATTDSFLYDGEGNRIEQVVQQSGVGETDTVYVGGLEEVTTTTPTGGQPTTSTTAYYGGIALSVNGTLSFLASDNLGSATEALNTSGQVTASQLYTPYGDSRYSSGTFPTDVGFTGYVSDSATGLDYANARYYDPAARQFGSADPSGGSGLNGFGYVGGSPETATDPSGLLACDAGECGSGGEAGYSPALGLAILNFLLELGFGVVEFFAFIATPVPGVVPQQARKDRCGHGHDICASHPATTATTSSAPPTSAPNWSLAKAAEMAAWDAREASQPQGCGSSDCGGGGSGGGGGGTGGGTGVEAPSEAPPEPQPATSGAGATAGGGNGCSRGGGGSDGGDGGNNGPTDPLSGWLPHTGHFLERWLQRGQPSIEGMNYVLQDGIPILDTETGDIGLAEQIGRAWYTIWYHPSNNVLSSITDSSSGSYIPDKHMNPKWKRIRLDNPNWQSPFCK